MMKFQKATAILLSALLLCGAVPAFAADTSDGTEPQVLTVSYSDLENYVRSSNQTIRANKQTLEALQDNDLAEQKIGDLHSSAASLSGVSKMLQQADAAVNALPASTQTQSIDKSLQGSIASISAICSILDSEADQLETDDDQIDKTELQMKDAADQIVVAAQKLFVTYHILDSQRSVLTEQQQVLAAAYQADQLRAQVGLMSQTDLLNAQQQQNTAADQLAKLVSQMKAVRDNLRILLGYSDDYSLKISSMPQADSDKIAKMNYDADYRTALDSNWTLQEKRKEIDIADEDYDRDLDSTVETRKAALLNRDLAKNQFDAAFRQAYDDVALKRSLVTTAQSAYDAKEKALEAVKQKNSLGIASELDVKNAQMDCDSAKASLSQAQYGLFSSQEQYRWGLLGVLDLSSCGG
ncbi:Outer membrane efflux protein [Caprobacter fermentans]|uniref:Outer membrane efflux protein n=1 Tax=Caproicibacter fermentans TaxID=2576756 RepID=A0A6N8HWV6_9FIRM|nr:TolC family protein [Caproicibacter fermentans]MVB10321.1 Outer membrane efflux protein [Caproicibacter fermentans]